MPKQVQVPLELRAPALQAPPLWERQGRGIQQTNCEEQETSLERAAYLLTLHSLLPTPWVEVGMEGVSHLLIKHLFCAKP